MLKNKKSRCKWEVQRRMRGRERKIRTKRKTKAERTKGTKMLAGVKTGEDDGDESNHHGEKRSRSSYRRREKSDDEREKRARRI